MKKVFLVIPALTAGLVVGGLVQHPDAVTGATRRAGSSSTATVPFSFNGVVVAVNGGDPAQGERQTVVVDRGDGKQMTFVIAAGTRVYDKNATAPLSAKVAKDNRVAVKYTITAGGKNVAREVTISE